MDTRGIEPRVIYRAVLLAFGLGLGLLVFSRLVSVLLVVLLTVVVAVALARAADWLGRRGVPRVAGVLGALLFALAVVVGLAVLLVPTFSDEVDQFVKSLPTIVDELRRQIGQATGTSPGKAGVNIQHFVNGYTQHPDRLLGPAVSIGQGVAGAVGAIVVVLLTAVYCAIQPGPLVEGGARLFPPTRRDHVRHVMSRLAGSYMGWLRGLVVGAAILGVLTYLGLLAVGLPFAIFFSILTAVAIVVPYFGSIVSSVPPILYALTISPTKAVLVTLIYIGAHQIEGNVIGPLVMARAVRLHPALVAIGVVAVGELFGFAGLLVAVPIITTVKILFEEFWVLPMEGDRAPTLVQPSAAGEQTPPTPDGAPPERLPTESQRA
jgi:predicted PurR-regulated permease PerM